MRKRRRDRVSRGRVDRSWPVRGTAIIQGTIAGVGYAVARLPEPWFFAAMTAVASLVPVFGTLLVWIPAGLALLFGGHTAAGIFELLWESLAVVSLLVGVAMAVLRVYERTRRFRLGLG